MTAAGCANELTPEPVQLIDERALNTPDTAPVDGYALLVAPRTQGLFPTAVAVARLQPGEADPTAAGEPAGRWAVASIPVARGNDWNTLLTHTSQIREIIVLDAASTERPVVDMTAVLRAARRRGADLCFAYGVTCDDPQGYRMVGLLYDAAGFQPIAAVRAEAGPSDFVTSTPDRHDTDLRHRDSAYLCARKLQAHLRDCLLELVARDDPAATQPSPWAESPPPAEFIILPSGVR